MIALSVRTTDFKLSAGAGEPTAITTVPTAPTRQTATVRISPSTDPRICSPPGTTGAQRLVPGNLKAPRLGIFRPSVDAGKAVGEITRQRAAASLVRSASALRGVHRPRQIAASLHVEPEIGTVAKHPQG